MLQAVAAAEEPPAPEEPEEAEGDGGGSPPEGEVMAGPPERHISMLDRCRAVDQFEKLNRISEGTYGVVYRCVLSPASCYLVAMRPCHRGNFWRMVHSTVKNRPWSGLQMHLEDLSAKPSSKS